MYKQSLYFHAWCSSVNNYSDWLSKEYWLLCNAYMGYCALKKKLNFYKLCILVRNMTTPREALIVIVFININL